MATVLFVCKANRGRSVMSELLLERAAAGRHHAISAGSEADPGAGGPHPEVVDALRELGIDAAGKVPQRLTTDLAAQADAVVTMGCGDACPIIPGKKQLRLDWELPDPNGLPLEQVRATRDDIARRVEDLLETLDATKPAL